MEDSDREEQLKWHAARAEGKQAMAEFIKREGEASSSVGNALSGMGCSFVEEAIKLVGAPSVSRIVRRMQDQLRFLDYQPMPSREFWTIVDKAASDMPQAPSEAYQSLRRALIELDDMKIIGFGMTLYEELSRSYTHELWSAGNIMSGLLTDDSFTYFRLWLMSKGQEVYFSAIEDPDSLADVQRHSDDGRPVGFESFLYVGEDAFNYRRSDEFRQSIYDQGRVFVQRDSGISYSDVVMEAQASDKVVDHNSVLGGEHVPEDALTLKTRFPRLWAKYRE